MVNEIAPAFKRLIRKMPEWWLYDLRMKLDNLADASAGTQSMIIAIDAELLRRKWSRDLA